MKFDINAKNENLFNQFENPQTTGNLMGNLTGKFSPLSKAAKGSGVKGSAVTGGVKSSFKNELSKLATGSTFVSKTKNIENLEHFEFAHTEKLESLKIEKNDALFFINLLEKNGVETSISASGKGEYEAIQNQKSANVSKTLMNLLQKANDTKSPVRLDFDNNITLVLRVDKEGKLNAQFFPSDKIAEEYLKNNIPFLRQQFDEKEIKYSNISYHSQKDEKGENRQNNKQQKENDHE